MCGVCVSERENKRNIDVSFLTDAMMDEGTANYTASSSSIDPEEWASLLERKRSSYVCDRQSVKPIHHGQISRVPQKLYELDKNAYDPISLCIGPYHHGKQAFHVWEKFKWSYLNYILQLNPANTLQDYLNLLVGLEQEARTCYADELVIEPGEFIKMLLLDECFLLISLYGIQGIQLPATGTTEVPFVSESKIQSFEKVAPHKIGEQHSETRASSTRGKCKSAHEVQHSPNQYADCRGEDPNMMRLWKNQDALLLQDLHLLENQIPFFVVKRIYELFAGECQSSSLDDRIGQSLENIVGYPIPLRETYRPTMFQHLLQYWHMYLRPTEDREEQEHHTGFVWFRSYFKRNNKELNIEHTSDKSKLQKNIGGHHLIRWRRAEQYQEAGVHFQRRVFRKNDRHSLLDIRFTNGLIEIPSLVVAWHTASFFKNIIAFEQTCPQYGNYFTSYCSFLSQMVIKPADVTLLAKRGILVHHLRTDEEVSSLLTKLGKSVDFDINGSHYLKSICSRMEEHYQSRINRWMAWLWHNHFSNPWLSLAVLAAAIVLLCTILQTLITFLAYFYPAEA